MCEGLEGEETTAAKPVFLIGKVFSFDAETKSIKATHVAGTLRYDETRYRFSHCVKKSPKVRNFQLPNPIHPISL